VWGAFLSLIDTVSRSEKFLYEATGRVDLPVSVCLHNTGPSYLAQSLQVADDVKAQRRLLSTDCVAAARTWLTPVLTPLF